MVGQWLEGHFVGYYTDPSRVATVHIFILRKNRFPTDPSRVAAVYIFILRKTDPILPPRAVPSYRSPIKPQFLFFNFLIVKIRVKTFFAAKFVSINASRLSCGLPISTLPAPDCSVAETLFQIQRSGILGQF